MWTLPKDLVTLVLNSKWAYKSGGTVVWTISRKVEKVGTSNWARKPLTSQQINYAAADAYAALLVFEELRNQNYYLLTFHKLFKPHFKRKVIKVFSKT